MRLCEGEGAEPSPSCQRSGAAFRAPSGCFVLMPCDTTKGCSARFSCLAPAQRGRVLLRACLLAARSSARARRARPQPPPRRSCPPLVLRGGRQTGGWQGSEGVLGAGPACHRKDLTPREIGLCHGQIPAGWEGAESGGVGGREEEEDRCLSAVCADLLTAVGWQLGLAASPIVKALILEASEASLAVRLLTGTRAGLAQRVNSGPGPWPGRAGVVHAVPSRIRRLNSRVRRLREPEEFGELGSVSSLHHSAVSGRWGFWGQRLNVASRAWRHLRAGTGTVGHSCPRPGGRLARVGWAAALRRVGMLMYPSPRALPSPSEADSGACPSAPRPMPAGEARGRSSAGAGVRGRSVIFMRFYF